MFYLHNYLRIGVLFEPFVPLVCGSEVGATVGWSMRVKTRITEGSLVPAFPKTIHSNIQSGPILGDGGRFEGFPMIGCKSGLTQTLSGKMLLGL